MTETTNRGLDDWLRHTMETMLMRANVLNNGTTKDALFSWAKEIESAMQVIEKHNQTCPREFSLLWPEGTDLYGIGKTESAKDF